MKDKPEKTALSTENRMSKKEQSKFDARIKEISKPYPHKEEEGITALDRLRELLDNIHSAINVEWIDKDINLNFYTLLKTQLNEAESLINSALAEGLSEEEIKELPDLAAIYIEGCGISGDAMINITDEDMGGGAIYLHDILAGFAESVVDNQLTKRKI